MSWHRADHEIMAGDHTLNLNWVSQVGRHTIDAGNSRETSECTLVVVDDGHGERAVGREIERDGATDQSCSEQHNPHLRSSAL
jgi:hypothetical protein